MTDKRKYNKGQPRKPAEEKKVPLTFHVRSRNRAAIKAKVGPVIKKLDI